MGKQKRHRRPASTPDAREAQVISHAIDLAERQILDGTASSQVITHFLKLGSTHAELEREKLRQDTELQRKKIESIDGAQRLETLFEDAISAMKRYQGRDDEDARQEEEYYED